VGLAPGPHPPEVPWAARAGSAFGALFARGGDPEAFPFLRELPRAARETYAQAGAAARLAHNAARSVHLAWDGWAWLAAAAALAAAHRHRRIVALGVPLLAALPALCAWSQRRHVLVFLPLALAVCAAGVRGRGGVLLLLLAAPWMRSWPRVVSGQQSEVHRARSFAAAASWLAAHAPEGSLLGGRFQDVGLYHPLPRHDPDGSPADWHTFAVEDRPSYLPGWMLVASVPGGLHVFRRDLAGDPCPTGRPAPSAPHLAVARAHADLVGCEALPGTPFPR
jgi:hypothetical protein